MNQVDKTKEPSPCLNRVAIILAVYNGEKYLAEQIQSLIDQTYDNLDIYVYDDGSSDRSREIIKEYADLYSNISVIDNEKKLGYPECFICTLGKCSGYDFYAFCDQDDVWSETKIENGINILSREDDRTIPLLYYTAVEYCDEKLQHVRSSRFARGLHSVEQMPFRTMLFGGEAMGMTYLFNGTAREALLEANRSGKDSYKDWFLKLYCSLCGKVFYDPRPSAKYRRHESAVTNSTNPSGLLGRYIKQISEIFLTGKNFENQKSFIDYIKGRNGNEIYGEELRMIDLFSPPNTINKRFRKIFWPHRYRRRIIDEIGYRVAFLLGYI